MWNVAEKKLEDTFKGHKNWVLSTAFTPDGKNIITGGYDNRVNVWGSDTGVLLKSYPGHKSAVWSVSISGDSKTIASGSQDGTVKMWEIPAPRRRATF